MRGFGSTRCDSCRTLQKSKVSLKPADELHKNKIAINMMMKVRPLKKTNSATMACQN